MMWVGQKEPWFLNTVYDYEYTTKSKIQAGDKASWEQELVQVCKVRSYFVNTLS